MISLKVCLNYHLVLAIYKIIFISVGG